jgi:hypothetical protein
VVGTQPSYSTVGTRHAHGGPQSPLQLAEAQDAVVQAVGASFVKLYYKHTRKQPEGFSAPGRRMHDPILVLMNNGSEILTPNSMACTV